MNQSPPESLIQSTWTERERRIVWFVVSKARFTLQIEISPVIASAYILLQNYFRTNSNQSKYKLLTLVVASLFSSCKFSDCLRPVDLIYSVILRICQSIDSQMVKAYVDEISHNELFQVTKQEVSLVHNAEFDILDSIEFNVEIELPFKYIEKWKTFVIPHLPEKLQIVLLQKISIDICYIICSDSYLDVPPEVTAAVAIFDIMKNEMPQEPDNYGWINHLMEKYGDDKFNIALNSLSIEKQRTVHRPVLVR